MSEPYPIPLQHARASLWELAKLGGQNTQLAMRYIGLFAPVNDKLSFEEIYRLLCEINGIWQDCPSENWQKAVQSVLNDKIADKLTIPLKNHDILLGYLADLDDLKDNEDEEHIIPSTPPKTPDPPPNKIRTEEEKAFGKQCIEQMQQSLRKAPKFENLN